MDTLPTLLEQLESRQLVHRTSDEDLSYLFKHTLTHETVYESLLLKRRREIHRLVAHAYERIYPERLDEFAALLAAHYVEAGDDAEVMNYATRAGTLAARLYANTEAAALYSFALTAAKRTNAPSPAVQELYLKRGRVLELHSRFDEAARNYDEMQDEADRRADPAFELAALLARATIRAIPGSARDPEQARILANGALPLARQLDDRSAEAKIYWILLLANIYWGGNRAEAILNGERSLALARELNLREQVAYSLQDLSTAYLYRGYLDKGRQARLEAAQLWRELNDKPMLTENIVGMGVLSYLLGDYPAALEFAREGLAISEEIGNFGGQGFAGIVLTVTHIQLGEFDEALHWLDEAIPIAEQGGLEGNGISLLGLHAWICACCGEGVRARELIREAFGQKSSEMVFQRRYLYSLWARIELRSGHTAEAERIMREGEVKPDVEQFEGMFPPTARIPYLASAELALAQGNYALAIKRLDELLELFERRGMCADRALVLWYKGQALLGLNQREQAMTAWGKARVEAEARQERPVLWQILLALAQAERDGGNSEEAQRLCSQARGVVQYIAEHAPAQYVKSFLNLPEVKQLLNDTPSGK